MLILYEKGGDVWYHCYCYDNSITLTQRQVIIKNLVHQLSLVVVINML